MQEIQERLGTGEASAEAALKSLSKLSNRLSVRSNPLVYFALNILGFWDYRCAFRFEAWKQRYAGASAGWFLALGELESLLSLANLPLVCDTVCLPTINTSAKTIQAMALGHPLLSNSARVSNDLSLQDQILIISGSNMSGKTTFLRTVGINLVLAQSGSLVCANQFSFSPLQILTSMRITDDLNEGVSTFYAELKRIKNLLNQAKEQPNLLFLIDELFRGTNSTDRLSGAQAVLSRLNQLQAAGMITTHDLDLCNLAAEVKRIQNYHFAEYYQEDKIYFDYQLKSGKSVTTNAQHLMKLLGIL